MKQYLQTQKGSVMVLSLLTVVFLTIILSGLMPFVNSQVLHSSINNDTVEAQYAAEAGAKRAIIGIKNNRTDWAWANGSSHNNFDNTMNKHYITRINPPIIDGNNPTANDYTIISDGSVGNAHKRVIVSVRTASTANGPFSYAAFSRGDMLIQNPLITGDIFSNANIRTTSGAKMVTGKAYSKTQSIENSLNITGGYTAIADPLTLDINKLMPTLSKIGTNLKDTWGTTGQWGNHTYPLTQGSYYYDGPYDLNGHSYSIDSGVDVTIYVNGKFTLMSNSSINGGNLTIYATEGIDFNGGSLNNSVTKIYANGDINLSSNSSINSSAGMLVTTGNVDLNGGPAANMAVIAEGNVKGSNGSTVAGIYANGTLTMVGTKAAYNDKILKSLGLTTNLPFEVLSWSDK